MTRGFTRPPHEDRVASAAPNRVHVFENRKKVGCRCPRPTRLGMHPGEGSVSRRRRLSSLPRRGAELESLAGRASNRGGGGARVLVGHGPPLFGVAPWSLESHPPRCIWWQRREPHREVRRHRPCLALLPVSSVTGGPKRELQRRCPSGAEVDPSVVSCLQGAVTKATASFGHERGAPRDARDGFIAWRPTETDRPARTAMGNHRGLWMTRPRAAIRSVRTGVDAAGALSPLLISWRTHSKHSERFIGTARAWGRPQRIEVLAAEVSPHPSTGVRARWQRAESERREAPSGRARSANEASVGGLVPSMTMEDATHVMAEAVLSDPCPAKDHESFTER